MRFLHISVKIITAIQWLYTLFFMLVYAIYCNGYLRFLHSGTYENYYWGSLILAFTPLVLIGFVLFIIYIIKSVLLKKYTIFLIILYLVSLSLSIWWHVGIPYHWPTILFD